MPNDNNAQPNITVSGLFKSLTETKNLFVLVLSGVTSVIAFLKTQSWNEIAAAAVSTLIVVAALGWIYYRQQKNTKTELPYEISERTRKNMPVDSNSQQFQHALIDAEEKKVGT